MKIFSDRDQRLVFRADSLAEVRRILKALKILGLEFEAFACNGTWVDVADLELVFMPYDGKPIVRFGRDRVMIRFADGKRATIRQWDHEASKEECDWSFYRIEVRLPVGFRKG